MTPPNGNGSSISDRARSGVGPDPQDGMFDKEWSDPDLEAALEAREASKDRRSTANKDFKVKDTVVKDRLNQFSLAVGEVARVGRFRIKKERRAGNSISFETEPREQLSIKTD
jgi:hypothetical protein